MTFVELLRSASGDDVDIVSSEEGEHCVGGEASTFTVVGSSFLEMTSFLELSTGDKSAEEVFVDGVTAFPSFLVFSMLLVNTLLSTLSGS